MRVIIYFIICFMLCSCGEDSPVTDTQCHEPKNILEYATNFCDSHLGVKQWSGPTAQAETMIDCLDGTSAYIKNFRLP